MKIKQVVIIIMVLIVGIFIGKFVLHSETKKENSTDNLEKHWTCSMHPNIDLPEFGDCPICGMDLISRTSTVDDDIPENAFKMTKNAMALANIETFEVGNTSSDNQTNSIFLSGKIKTNEKETNIQIANFGGRIQKIYIKSIGEYVKTGELIASVYSPELVSVQNELIEAVDIKEAQPELYESIKNKMRLWKISETQIQKIENTKKVIINFNLYSNVSGYVTDIYKEEGSHIIEGASLFKVANLDKVWADFDVYEQDIKSVHMGQTISMTLNAYPNEEIKSKIDFIDPILNTNTRTVTVRATILNKSKLLKPGMFVSAVVYTDINDTLKKHIIPKSSVLWTGKRSVVYVKVKKNEPVFEMRKVKLGADLGEYYEILSGLKVGEMIVSNGTFTVDAAAQLSGKNSMMSSSNDEIESFEVSEEFLKHLNYLFEDYTNLRDNLVEANAHKANESAKEFHNSLLKIPSELLRNKKAYKTWLNSSNKISKDLNTISLGKDIEKKRLAFINVSIEMINIVKGFGVQDTVYIVHCPMADENRGADWISFENEVVNPYFGNKMLHCGSVKQIILK